MRDPGSVVGSSQPWRRRGPTAGTSGGACAGRAHVSDAQPERGSAGAGLRGRGQYLRRVAVRSLSGITICESRAGLEGRGQVPAPGNGFPHPHDPGPEMPCSGPRFPLEGGGGVVHRRRLRPCGRGVDLGLDRAAVRIRTTAPEAPKRVGRWSGRPVPAQEAAPDPLRSPSRWMI